MFGRKTKASIQQVNDSGEVVNDFTTRTSGTGLFESYRPVEYTLYYKLDESVMIPQLEEYLRRLLSADVDDANGSMLDAVLFSAAREALPDLERQRQNHLDVLDRFIMRRNADYTDLIHLRDDRMAECRELQERYDHLSELLAQLEEE